MKKCPRFFVSVVLLILCASANAQALWQNTTLGMSEQAIKEAYPEARRPANPGTLAEGLKEALCVEGYKLSNNLFRISFYTKEDKLVQVALDCTNEKTFGAQGVIFDSLTEALRSKYGNELSKMRDSDVRKSVWMSGRTNITLFLMAIDRKESVLRIIYQVRLAAEGDKL